jgi:hypothetical protein
MIGGMGAMEVRYAYAARSAVRSSGGRTEVGLATTEPETFLDGCMERGDVVAAALLAVGTVAATRFYAFLTAAQRAELIDPIITTGNGTVRFESLSACCGVAARLDLLPDGIDADTTHPGTTNVDLGPRMRQLLAGVLRHDPLHLRVGEFGLEARTLTGEAHERKVDLPDRWIRSLAELQVLASRMTPRVELDAAQARSFVRSLPVKTSYHGTLWAQPAVGGLRLGTTKTAGAVALGGPERLRPLAGVLRHATRLRVYAADADGPAPSWWELDLPHARLGLGLSPETSRGFSGEGALLTELAADGPDAYLAASGMLGFDLAQGGYFPRVLPFGLDVLRAHPRLEKARTLVADGGVRTEGDHLVVRGTRFDHVVRLGPPATCTCAWYAEHRGSRGPCAHVLAARVFADPTLVAAEAALAAAGRSEA